MLTERQRLVLSAIVDDYIRSAEPVGSRSISKRGEVGFSAATIRNEMSDLEELGFLEQPHTSAGRIPSHKGYRYYVDHLVQLRGLDSREKSMLKVFFAEKMEETEQVVQQAAMILSSLTNYTSIVLGPEMFNTTLKHLQIVPLNEKTAVAIIVTNTGHVENKTVTIPDNLPIEELEKFVNLLNAKLKGVSLLHFRAKLYNEISSEMSKYVSQYEELLHMLENVVEPGDEDRIFVSGSTNILTQPEFRDVDKVKGLLDLFAQPMTLMKLFHSVPEGIQVRIGAENENEAISQCSLITATYSVGGQSLGTIGIVGPTRMEYGKVISLLDLISRDVSSVIGRLYK
ncbi:heat-inducible transcriptional repressor HrcA [Paenibacillus sp. y28]|uniref:heat-inducible transcriptional repressor HrcA n=1 Tax=Paenibacillus sp. y28 TaxID=3129110 RepID=UPI003017A557